MIIAAAARQFYAETEDSWLSSKTMRHGWARYTTVNHTAIAVDDSGYLVLNAGQPYTILIDSPVPVQSFCVFFDPAEVSDVSSYFTSTPEKRLEQGAPVTTRHFFETLHPHDDLISPMMRRIEEIYQQGQLTPALFRQLRFTLLERLVQRELRIHNQIDVELDAARMATREEQFKRIHIAYDFIRACFADSLTLDDIASVVALSPYHFHRLFKQIVGITPHHALTRIRLERAQYLLKFTDNSILDICVDVGFVSPGSFSTLFKRWSGVLPEHFRARFKKR